MIKRSLENATTVLRGRMDIHENLQIILDLREEKSEQRGSPVEELDIVQLQQGDQSKCTRVGQPLTLELCAQIESFLKANSDVFAWSHEDIAGINPEVIPM